MKELIDQISEYVAQSSQQIQSLEDSNKKLREEIHSLTKELEFTKQNKSGNKEIEKKYEDLLEERDVIQGKVETVLEQINRLHIKENGNT